MKHLRQSLVISSVLVSFLTLLSTAAYASTDCKGLPSQQQVQGSLEKMVESGNGGIFKPNAMWAAVVNRAGEICVIAKTGDAWPGSRVIAAQKASTANSFSNERLSLSTANIYSAVQPGGSLYGLQHSNPLNPVVLYKGDAKKFGTAKDPMKGERPGGVNVFGGGLALYDKDGKTVLGGLGVSGDSSCANHNIAWRMRDSLGFIRVPGGVSGTKDDNIVYDIDAAGKSASGFGHPVCSPEATEMAKNFKAAHAG